MKHFNEIVVYEKGEAVFRKEIMVSKITPEEFEVEEHNRVLYDDENDEIRIYVWSWVTPETLEEEIKVTRAHKWQSSKLPYMDLITKDFKLP